MRKHGTTSYRLIDWLLVLALSLAPLQGAWSAFDRHCEHEQLAATAHYDDHTVQLDTAHSSQARKCSHHMQHQASPGGSSPAGDCCCHSQNKSGSRCTGNCQPVPVALYLPSLRLDFSFEIFTAFETSQPVFSNGRTVPPPYQPPRS